MFVYIILALCSDRFMANYIYFIAVGQGFQLEAYLYDHSIAYEYIYIYINIYIYICIVI